MELIQVLARKMGVRPVKGGVGVWIEDFDRGDKKLRGRRLVEDPARALLDVIDKLSRAFPMSEVTSNGVDKVMVKAFVSDDRWAGGHAPDLASILSLLGYNVITEYMPASPARLVEREVAEVVEAGGVYYPHWPNNRTYTCPANAEPFHAEAGVGAFLEWGSDVYGRAPVRVSDVLRDAEEAGVLPLGLRRAQYEGRRDHVERVQRDLEDWDSLPLVTDAGVFFFECWELPGKDERIRFCQEHPAVDVRSALELSKLWRDRRLMRGTHLAGPIQGGTLTRIDGGLDV